MPGEKDLSKMLTNLSPELIEGEYVFCTFKDSSYGDYSNLEPLASIKEKEGLTLILLKDKAQQEQLSFEGVFHCISFGVYSDLNSVGLMAAITNKLAQNDISSNIISGYFHDHLFISKNKSKMAMEVLTNSLY